MKLVIDISKTLKELADKNDTKILSHDMWNAIMINAIKNGKILPKGHGKLIDADAYSAEMKKRQDACAECRDNIKSIDGDETEQYYRADAVLSAFIEAKLTLNNTPTIIEADKEGEG